MSRVEECEALAKEVNDTVSSLTIRCEEPDFIERFMAGIEAAKLTVLMDIAQSLAVLADGLSDD